MPHAREIISFFIAPPIASAKTPSRQRDDPNLAKTLSFSVRASAPRARLLSSESSKPLLSLPAMQSSRGSLPFGRVSASSGAPFIPTIARSLRRAQNLPALATARETLPDFMARCAPSRYCSLRCAPPLTVLPPPMERSLSISRREIVASAKKYRQGQAVSPQLATAKTVQ